MSMYDPQIREVIRREFGDRRFVDEINAYKSRVDLLDITDTLTAWEIKSDNDSLARLDKQIQNYCKFFPYVNVVSGSKYVERLKNSLPSYIGIWEVYKCPVGNPVLECVRESAKNPQMKSSYTLSLLWKRRAI